MKESELDITDKTDKKNTGWFSEKQAEISGAIIYKNLRSGYPVLVSCIQEEAPDFEDVVKVGPVGEALKLPSKYSPKNIDMSDAFDKLFEWSQWNERKLDNVDYEYDKYLTTFKNSELSLKFNSLSVVNDVARATRVRHN